MMDDDMKLSPGMSTIPLVIYSICSFHLRPSSARRELNFSALTNLFYVISISSSSFFLYATVSSHYFWSLATLDLTPSSSVILNFSSFVFICILADSSASFFFLGSTYLLILWYLSIAKHHIQRLLDAKFLVPTKLGSNYVLVV